MKARLLIVEDERAIQIALSGLLKKEGYEVRVAGSGEAAMDALRAETFDLVLTDLALGGEVSGMEVLRASRAARREVPVVMITAQGNEKTAVEAMKAGAADYVPKPFDNDALRLVIHRALERTQLEREHRLLLDRIQAEYGFGRLIGSGPGMRQVFEIIRKVAETDLTVLVRGESGTGKELVAQALHDRSVRRDRPFVAVNCAAISPELVESELFGHEKGAFTGAGARRAGRFEAAEGGTIFLDEIGDMPAATQAKVLRVLQERQLERVGGTTPIDLDVRVIAATHRDLEEEVREGRFREDLYYRLEVVEIDLPPLRERSEDIPALIDSFLTQLAERLGRDKVRMSPEAVQALIAHPWPGNVRELRNVVEQSAVLASGEEILASEIRLGRRADRTPVATQIANMSFTDAKKAAMERWERAYVSKVMAEHKGNISRAAKSMKMARQSLQHKLRDLDLSREDFTGEE